jgi:integrase
MEKDQTATVSLTILPWSDEYLDYAKDRFTQKTYKEKKSAFKRLLHFFDPQMFLSDICPAYCKDYLGDQTQTRSGYAINKDRKNLASGWEWGRKFLIGFPQGINPFKAVEKLPEIRSPRYVPSEEDFWAVYDKAEGQDQVMLLTAMHLAARRSEIFGLTWADVDFGLCQIRLWTRKRKGGHKEPDWLPMTTELRQSLVKWWDQRPVKNSAHVFVCLEELPCLVNRYGRPFVERGKFMRRLCKTAKVKPFGFHAIRHLTASILYRKGYSLGHIQAVLRHKNPNTTSRYLRSLGLEQVREALENGLKKPAKVIELKKKKAGNY